MGAEFGGNLPGEEPTPEEQYRFWDLEGQAATAGELHQRMQRACREAEGVPDDPDKLIEILHALRQEAQRDAEGAEQRLNEFANAHAGVSFRVFRPQDLRAALDPDIEVLYGDETEGEE